MGIGLAPAGLLLGMAGTNQTHLAACHCAGIANQAGLTHLQCVQLRPQVVAQTGAASHQRRVVTDLHRLVGLQRLHDLEGFRQRLLYVAGAIILVVLAPRGVKPALGFGQRVIVLGQARLVQAAQAQLDFTHDLAVGCDAQVC